MTHAPRPAHLDPRLLALVALGGAVGTALRLGVALVVPHVGGVDAAVLTVNVVGSFLLGALLEGLARRGDDTGRRRDLRLLLGTGVLGGFTTYSALAAGTVVLAGGGGTAGAAATAAAGDVVLALVTAVVSVAAGVLAAGAGVVVGGRASGRRRGRDSGPRPRTDGAGRSGAGRP